MNKRDQYACLWALPASGVMFVAFFFLNSGFWPPISPNMTADQVAAVYVNNIGTVRASMLVYNFCGALLVPFYMVLVNQIKRIMVGDQVLAYSYLSLIASSAGLYAVADMFWLTAAFRPDRNPELILFLNDLAWISFLLPTGLIFLQNVIVAIAIYRDVGDRPVFPRWIGHFNLITAFLLVPPVLGMTLKSGPFAWDGAYTFWFRFAGFGIYMAVMFFAVRRAVIDQPAELAEVV